jgi:hypothetical protein
MLLRRSVGGLAAAVVAAAVSGCGGGDGLDRQSISGSVTLDGKPLEKGQIQFLPDVNAQGAATAGMAQIEGGSYSLSRADGLVPGSYKVSIYAGSGDAESAAPETPGAAPKIKKDLIPAKYNSQSKETAEVKAAGGNTFNFDLKSK